MHVCRCFPVDDEAFVAYVAQCDALLTDGRSEDPGSLEQLLRARYDRAVVRPQSDLAATRNTKAWYVYRDGRIVAWRGEGG
jgi:hypothetical protein